jgi:hypothetical protein
MYDGWKKNGAHTDSGGKGLMISSSMHFLWQLLQRLGVHASNVKTRGVPTRSY